MKNYLPENDIEKLSKFIGDHLGLNFPKEKWMDLERGLKEIADQYNFKDLASCLEWITRYPLEKSQIEILGNFFTVGETYFFRDKRCFEVLEKIIFPELIDARKNTTKTIRIWSAGCASGEEPYSIAILLTKLIPDYATWNITILASDVNPIAQQRVLQGIYGEWSFRETTRDVKNYFNKINNHYHILSHLKKMVTPLYLNLASDCYPTLLNNTNAMDIILCRNALMYFLPEHAKKVVEKLSQALIDEGYLILAAPEHALVQNEKLTPVNQSGVILYRKTSSKVHLKDEYLEIGQTYNQDDAMTDFYEDVDFEKTENSEAEVNNNILQKKNVEKSHEQEKNLKLPGEILDLELKSRDLANQGKLNEALALIDKAIDIQKFNENYHYLKGLILIEVGQLEMARTEFNKAIYLNNNFILPYFALGNIAYQQGDLSESKRYFLIVLNIIKKFSPETIIPGSEGMTVKRMTEIIESTLLTG